MLPPWQWAPCWDFFESRWMFNVYLPFNPFSSFHSIVFWYAYISPHMDLLKPDRSYLSQSNETISLSFFIFTFISTQMDGLREQRRKQKKLTVHTQQKQDKELKSIRWRESDVYCYSYFVDVSSGSPNEPGSQLAEKGREREYLMFVKFSLIKKNVVKRKSLLIGSIHCDLLGSPCVTFLWRAGAAAAAKTKLSRGTIFFCFSLVFCHNYFQFLITSSEQWDPLEIVSRTLTCVCISHHLSSPFDEISITRKKEKKKH